MEKLLIFIRIPYRILGLIFITSGFLMKAFAIHFTVSDPIHRIDKFSKNASFFTRLICRFYNIEISVINGPPLDQVGLVVGNHMGFIDILVVNSLMPSLFVTSQEMRQTPLLGLLCELGGCLFVERRSRSKILGELDELVKHLKKGFRVTLYPEATSHNGEVILPFKRTLLTAAAHADVPILPYCFNFKSINDEAFTLKYRDSVCWYGPITFVQSFLRSSALRKISVEIEFLSPMKFKTDDNRAMIADAVREQIVKKFNPVQTERN